MASEIWFTSDSHFFHENFLKFKDKEGNLIRPFKSVEEMNDIMVQNWVRVVRPQDKIYHLGDLTFRYHHAFNVLMGLLPGHKRLVLGNHDRPKNPNLFRRFEKVYGVWRGFHEYGFTCSHIPLMLKSLRDGNVNVHGHIHEKLMEDPHYINVCVEQTNYTPIHLDEIRQIINGRNL